MEPSFTRVMFLIVVFSFFLWMATKDGKHMEGEEMFVYQFGCLQKRLDWCYK